MTNNLCPYCDAPLRPDPDRPGALWCDGCQEAVRFEDPEIESVLSMPIDTIADSAGLTARAALLAFGSKQAAIEMANAVKSGRLVIGPDGRPIE